MDSNNINPNPRTPRIGNSELIRILKSLNSKFFLELPDEEFSSPSSRIPDDGKKETPIEVRCGGLIKFLFFKAGPKLDRLILDFEEWARPRLSQWLWKDWQEPGTLPIRTSFIRRDMPSGRAITADERHELLEHLLRLLVDEYYLIMGKMPDIAYPKTASSSNRSSGRVYDALRSHDPTDTYARRSLFSGNNSNGSGNQSHITNIQPPTKTASSFPGTGKRKSAEDQEVFTTAPNSPITASPIPDEFLDEFEDLDLNDFDLDSITKADVDVGDQKPKSSKKRQSRIDKYMASSGFKATEPAQTQVNKSMMSEAESASSSTMPFPSIFSRNQSLLGVSFGSDNTDTTEPIDPVDENASTQSSSIRDILDNEEFSVAYNAACENAGQPIPPPEIADDAIVAELAKSGPFARRTTYSPKIQLRYRYELERIASWWELPVEKVLAGDHISFNSHPEFWKWVERHSCRPEKGHSCRAKNLLPEKSSARAWNYAVGQYRDTGRNGDVVTLSGELEWCDKSGSGYLKLNLKPMKLERGCRFYRRFGSDRFLSITIPYPSKAPKHLTTSPGSLQQSIAKWLATTDHHCLGRVWRTFYLEELTVKAVKGKEKPEMRMKVHLFAIDGTDFVGTSPRQCEIAPENQTSERHTPMSLLSLINWHMPFGANIQQSDCKLFQRFKLGLSKTMPSVALRTNEILHLKDPPGKTVMNDGCARMSKSLAIHIADMLDIGGITPSCFQGRIAGAKGIWMVDRDDTAFKAGDRNYWIQISDSQLKIKPHPAEVRGHVDPDKLTFEIVNWSKPLHAVDLNIQLLTILEHRGVPREYIESLIHQQIKLLYDEFVEIVRTGNRLGCRRLMQKLRPPGDDWARKKTRRIGGWPMDNAEQIIFLLESGFEPLTCPHLFELLKGCLKDFLDRYVDRLQIGVPLSTYAYCIADPYGVLEEDEVHFGLSQAWDDPAFSDTVFDNIDVLVGRLPAHYPSDIQKRKAVWKSELRHLKNAIVFSIKGKTPLAHMLSGGDYDGDTPWICWDPEIVNAFENVGLPERTPSEKEFGLVNHSKSMQEVNLSSVDEFLYNSFNFNFRPCLLGICTAELEKLSYETSIDSEAAIHLSSLVSFLVDSRKAGLELTQDAWRSILKKVSRDQRQLPAYKSSDSRNWKQSNIIDYLKFKVAEGEKDKVLSDFAKVHKERKDDRKDEDLTRIWNQTLDRSEEEKKCGKPELLNCLKGLRDSIKRTQSEWFKANVSDKITFAASVQAATDSIQNIKPPRSDHHLIITWQNSEYEWDKVRASCLYKHHNGKFPWYSVGETLCGLKAEANSPTRTLTEDIYLAHRLDTKRSKRIEARESGEEGEEEMSEEEEVFEGEEVFLDADYYYLSME